LLSGGIRPTFGRSETSRLPNQLASEDFLANCRLAVLTPNASTKNWCQCDLATSHQHTLLYPNVGVRIVKWRDSTFKLPPTTGVNYILNGHEFEV